MNCNKCGKDASNIGIGYTIMGLCNNCFDKHTAGVPYELLMAMAKEGVSLI